jgi:OmpA-OmpF porin, OOP family
MRIHGALYAAAMIALPVIASAQPVAGPYVSLGAGFDYRQQQDIKSITLPGLGTTRFGGGSGSPRVDTDTGYLVLGSVGYGLGNGIRFEVEGSYRNNSIDKIQTGLGSSSASGSTETYAVMGNAYYDFDLSPFGIEGIYPYIGAGAGYSWQDLNHVSFASSPIPYLFEGKVSGTEGAFAAQGMAGFAVPLPFMPGLSLTAEYRAFAEIGNKSYSGALLTPNGTVGGATVTPFKAKLGDTLNHSGILGLRYAFGVAPPPPPPAPVAPVEVPPTRSYLVFFDWDKATLTDRARQIIREAADASTHVQYTRIEVSGYTDTSGTPQYNQGLSVRRAEAVAAELVRDGVPRNVITIQGFGETHLLVPTGPGVREPQNRRVEIIIR